MRKGAVLAAALILGAFITVLPDSVQVPLAAGAEGDVRAVAPGWLPEVAKNAIREIVTPALREVADSLGKPKGPFGPETLIKLAVVQIQLGEKEAAFRTLTASCPKTHLNLKSLFLKGLWCEHAAPHSDGKGRIRPHGQSIRAAGIPHRRPGRLVQPGPAEGGGLPA